MSESDDRELFVLSHARKAFTPSASDAERVRASLDVALAGGAAASALAVSPADVGRVLRRLVLPALVAAGGAVGYGLGHRAGFAEGSAVVRTESPSSEAVVKKLEVPERIEAPAPAPLPLAPSAEPPRVAKGGALSPSTAPLESKLEEEVRLLKRVERALREGNPRYALALLDDLERLVPEGQLREERRAALVMARCQLGMGGAALAEEFEKAHPESAYVPRVKETCSRNDSKPEP